MKRTVFRSCRLGIIVISSLRVVFCRNYNHKSYDVYRMPVEVMRVGMVCAAQYIHLSSSDWHRCVITGFSDGFVQVPTCCLSITTLLLFVFI